MGASSKLVFGGKDAVLVVHGGAGAISRAKLTKSREKQARAALEKALKAGHHVVKKGGSSLDAVIAAVKVLEDAPVYNAGRGSCLTRAGKIEMDAAVMEGTALHAGAVAGVNCVKNPVTLARAVMEHTHHVLLVGQGANSFARKAAKKAGLEIVDTDYFLTENAERNLQRFLEAEAKAKRHGGQRPSGLTTDGEEEHEEPLGKKYGTVGAVAVDQLRHVAAATSTGGTVGKDPGRVGDSPLIGSGTYADDDTLAASATGYGEHFIRGAVCHEASSLVRYKGMTVSQTADRIFNVTLPRTGGDGGLILIDPAGNYAMRYNTIGMYRGVIFKDGTFLTAIYES